MAMAWRVKWLANAHDEVAARLSPLFLQSWIFLSIGVNVIVTGLVAYRLLKIRRQMATALAARDLKIYLGIVGILVESALPLTISGLVFAITFAPDLSANTGVGIARSVALSVWFSLTVCPLNGLGSAQNLY